MFSSTLKISFIKSVITWFNDLCEVVHKISIEESFKEQMFSRIRYNLIPSSLHFLFFSKSFSIVSLCQ